jgi:hypothetical protein
MTSRLVRTGPFILVLSLGAVAFAAQTSRETIRPASTATKSDPRRPAAKGPLPDPTLLDGAQHPAEKRSEHGMIGDFELPGDENNRDGRVGGGGQQQQNQQNEQQQQGQQGQQQAQAGGGQQPPQQPQEQGGGGGPDQQQQQAGGPQGAGQIAGQGDPNAKAEGIQVASLQGEGGGNPADANSKPQQVTIGDAAMQIKTLPTTPSVVGAQQPAGQTQQHEKTTGTGGRPPTGNNTNRGAEKGRTMPAGL